MNTRNFLEKPTPSWRKLASTVFHAGQNILEEAALDLVNPRARLLLLE